MNYGTIYSLTLFDGRTYVGQTIQDPYKYYQKEYVRKKGGGRCKLSNTIKKYGIESFDFDIIDYAETKEDLDKKECYWIKAYNCLDQRRGLNLRDGGSNGKPTEDSKKKMSLAHKGKKHSEETKKKMSEEKKGKMHSQETKKKIANSKKGKKHTQNTIVKMSKTKIGKPILKSRRPMISTDGSMYFDSKKEAYENGYTKAYEVANGTLKQTKGIIFRFATPEEIEERR